MSNKLDIPFNDDTLEKLGFTDYDDENCTWGNRRLLVEGIPEGSWSKIQIIEYDDCPEEHREAGFVYEGWFDNIRNTPIDSWAHMELKTVGDFVNAIEKWRPELFEYIKQLIAEKL